MKAEFEHFENNSLWYAIFQDIKKTADKYEYTTLHFKKPENKSLNRYLDVFPYDHTRIRLKRSDNDYINANLIVVEQAGRAYILTQGPLQQTIPHFWLMVWEQNSTSVVMLNKLLERGEVKCSQYWPNELDNEVQFDSVMLKVRNIGHEESPNYIIRRFLLTDLKTQSSREIKQYHYIAWPDFGIPESPTSFLEFLYCIRSKGDLDKFDNPPVIHCSAGIGRSGTFCLVDACLSIIKKSNQLDGVDIRKVLLEMRKYRYGLIQTPEQLRFSYLAIIKGSESIKNEPYTKINSNIDQTNSETSNSDDETNAESCLLKDRNPHLSNSSPSDKEKPKKETASSSTSTNKEENSSEVRKRVREERSKNLEHNIERMKRKMKENEEKIRLKKSLFKYGYYALGTFIALGAGLILYNYHFNVIEIPKKM